MEKHNLLSPMPETRLDLYVSYVCTEQSEVTHYDSLITLRIGPCLALIRYYHYLPFIDGDEESKYKNAAESRECKQTNREKASST